MIKMPEIFLVDDRRGFESLRPHYEALYAVDTQASHFLSPNWIGSILEENPGRSRIIALRDEDAPGGISALLPLERSLHWNRRQQMFQTRYTALGRLGLSSYTGFLCAPGREVDALPRLAKVIAEMPWGGLSIRYEANHHRADIFAQAFPKDEFEVTWPEHRVAGGKVDQLLCPVLLLPASYKAYLDSLNPKMRKRVRRAQSLTRGATFRSASPDSYANDRDQLLDLWSAHFEGAENETKRVAMVDRYRALLDRAQATGHLYLVSFWLGRTCLGASAFVADRRARRLHAVLEASNPQAAGLDIGLLLHAHVIRKAISAGCRALDFGHGNQDYKYRLGAENAETSNLMLRRRSVSAVPGFDPMMLGGAIRKTRHLILGNRTEDALAGLAQLERIVH
ncbi:GNAT family N-acetyltransferase [Primorskyibacter sp. S87]|uniref:GNAT family N-acetyltransferase n=1 Tax=Primorskyibacter sp. S87 TaxID=3415126 RepID=UPI003C7B55E3